MALINCPECGKEISDKAIFCIKCGFPLKEYLESNSVKDIAHSHVQANHLSDKNESHKSSSYKENINKIIKINIWSVLDSNIFLIAIFAVFVIMLSYNAFLNNDSSPKAVTEKFMKLTINGELKEAQKYLAEEIPWDVNAQVDKTVRIIINSLVEDIRGNEALVYVEFDEIPEPLFSSNPQRAVVYLRKIDGKWKIYDMQ